MHRADAEDAMDELCDADPLGTGRRMVLRWGKNVKKTVKFGERHARARNPSFFCQLPAAKMPSRARPAAQ